MTWDGAAQWLSSSYRLAAGEEVSDLFFFDVNFPPETRTG